MGACCSSKLSKVHSPSAHDRPGKDTGQHNQGVEQAIHSVPPPTTTTEDDVRATDEEVVIDVGGGMQPPGTVPGESPRTDRQVVSHSPPPVKPPSPKVDTKPTNNEPDKPPAPKSDPTPKAPEKLPVVPVETKVQPTKDSTAPSIEEAKPEASAISISTPQLPSFGLQPVSVFEGEIQDAVDKYSARIHADFQKTFDCTWTKLQQEIDKCKMLGITLEWYWITGGKVTKAVEEADGLVVIKVQKGSASKKGEIVHLSITGNDWFIRLPVIVDMLRKELFTNLPIKAIHVTLWYSENKDGKFAIEPSVEAVFKERSFRWFQLTNSSNGKRGQIMAQKRTADDCEMPEEVWDLSFSLCTFMPVGGDDSPKGDSNAILRPGMGSRVMIAECLRRHAPDNLKIEQTAEDQEGPTNPVEDVLTGLNKRGKGVREICSKDATKTTEAEEFFSECQCNTSLPSRTASEVKTWLTKKEGVERLICGGATLVLDWLSRSIEMNDAGGETYLRVPVHMLAKSSGAEHPLSYLGTNDDDVFIIVWPCKKDEKQSREDFLKECVNIIRNVEPIEEPLPFNEVLLPRFELQSFDVSVDIHKPAFRSIKCDTIHRPKELVSVELTAGQSYRGALKQAEPQERKEPFTVPVTGTGSFVFCVWHTKLDDLEEPLFLARVDPSDWCKELS